ncbi:hypothetical protein EJB05_30801, partial [Eragrostis curvula]
VRLMDGEKHINLEQQEEYNTVVNKTFGTEEEFYEFYSSYAKAKGFSVRRGKVRWKNELRRSYIWRRTLIIKKREPKELTRCGCSAKLDVKLSEERGMWFVSDFNDVHSHPLVGCESPAQIVSTQNATRHVVLVCMV